MTAQQEVKQVTARQQEVRRLAANEVLLADGSKIAPGVVELVGGIVVKTYPLTEELPRTEWVRGTIEIRLEADSEKAYLRKL